MHFNKNNPQNLTILYNAFAIDNTEIIIIIIEKIIIFLEFVNKDNLPPQEKSKNQKIIEDFINA